MIYSTLTPAVRLKCAKIFKPPSKANGKARVRLVCAKTDRLRGSYHVTNESLV